MLNVAMRARDQSSIFITGGKFHHDYGLLLELHTLTLVTYSYALLVSVMREDQPDDYVFHSIFVMYFHVFTVSEGTNSGAESSESSGSDSPRPSSEMDLCSEGEIVEGEGYGEGVVV